MEGVPLGDYLDRLVIQRIKGNDEIRAYGIRNLIRPKISNSLIEFSNTTGLKYKNVANWFGDHKKDVGVPISVLIKTINALGIDRDEIFRKMTVFGGTNTKLHTLPKVLTPDLAYLLGYIMGDGHLANPSDWISNGSKYNAEIRITTADQHHLVNLQKIFKKHFSYTPPLFKEGNFYRLVGRSKVIHRFLAEICDVPVGNKKDKTRIPEIVYKDNILSRYFVSGFFDADGTISTNNKKIRGIRIKQHNLQMLERCEEILIREGIKSIGMYVDNGIRKGTPTRNYVLAVQNQRDIKQFMTRFYSLKMYEKVVTIEKKSSTPYHLAIIPDGMELPWFMVATETADGQKNTASASKKVMPRAYKR